MEHKFKNTRRYLERDPFNIENEIECEISLDKGHKYGALVIHKINGDKIRPQIIYGTPKLKYPFDMNENWHFPSAARIISYRKYDGTNIFMYRYQYKGQYFTTYKVRLFPFLRGRILELWKRCLKKYPDIRNLFGYAPEYTGFAFEMYGNEHTHLIEYDEELEAKFLFALKCDNLTRIIMPVPPNDFLMHMNSGYEVLTDIAHPPAKKCDWVPRFNANIQFAEALKFYAKDYIYWYQEEQKKFEEDLVETENGFTGHEGSVWYLQDKKGIWHLFKCKPQSIEKIHWSSYPIDLNIIRATATNVLEVYEKVDRDSLVELLLEEFPKQQIELSERRIQKVLEEFDEKAQFQERVKILMKGLPDDLSVTDILRRLSGMFQKSEMSAVYQAVKFLKGE